MGINLGALIGPLVTGWLQKNWGFHAGFGAAAVGMAFGLAQYALSRKNLPDEAHHVTNSLPKTEYGKYAAVAAGALAVIVIAFTSGLVTPANLARVVAILAILASIAYFAFLVTSHKVERIERRRVLSFILLFHHVRGVLGAIPATVHGRGHLLGGEPGPQLLRLDHAAQLRAVHQPHLHHRAGRCVRHGVDQAGVPPTPVRRSSSRWVWCSWASPS
jgi:MFS family permease